jgi:hypothetical protein
LCRAETTVGEHTIIVSLKSDAQEAVYSGRKGIRNYGLLAASTASFSRSARALRGTKLRGSSWLSDGGIPLQNSSILQPESRAELVPEISAPFPPYVYSILEILCFAK